MIYSNIIEEDRIIASIANDPIFTKDDIDTNSSNLDVNHILETESQLCSQLHDLKNLKVLSSLIKEFNTNLDLLELENCYYSLQNLRKKLNENNEVFIKQSFHFQKSVVTYVDSLHVEFVNTIYDIFDKGFWTVTDDSIRFRSKIEWGNDHFLLQHNTLLDFLKQLFYPGDTLDPHLWIIDDMEFGNARDTVQTKIVDMLKNYILLNSVINLIKDKIFSKNTLIKYNEEEDTIKFIVSEPKPTVSMLLDCFQALGDFSLNTVPQSSLPVLLKSIGNVLGNELSKCVKSNAGEIIGHNNKDLKGRVSNINDLYDTLSSKSNEAWSYHSQTIKDLLQDRQLYINLLVDEIYNRAVNDIRATFDDKDDKWKTTSKVQLLSHINNQTKEASLSSSLPIEENNEDNDWNWDADAKSDHENIVEETPKVDTEDNEDDIADAWNDEIDIDMDLQSPKKFTNKSTIESPKKQTEKEVHEDDGWDEAWDIGEEDDDDDQVGSENVIAKRDHNNSSTEVKNHVTESDNTNISSSDLIDVTQLPTIYLDIAKHFRCECQSLEDDLTGNPYLNYKTSLLQTTFFAMAVAHCTDEWWKFYIDMREIWQKDNTNYRIQELAQRYLESNRLLRQKRVWKLVQDQLLEFHERENVPSWKMTLEDLLPFVHKEIITPLSNIRGKESEVELLRFLDFLYNSSITSVILKWEVISEKNSENLGRLISLISGNSEIESLNGSPQYREYRAKFEMVGRFLPLHLNEIMDMFYNGDFYLFSTEEIIQWVKLLFADTPIRKDAITDIYEIRQAALDDK
ncbi:similar to Saccharomyces cerevisiae YNL258C DSL1 Peripheral membrane protein needed for Golgi- to-ER retrograde traffic [Maudiozyma barnettii]|uniref:Similar to Saccharomyces cerevisiae YNL258C DSL1 Peripheral membrane protein needed for Golgi- to-ER retrograde traffic n=1 Tax=Maudiozyma barnettii TaxID=61262 RepID=A0A8H2ZJ24_9SACH|nr:Dsl1p [Kazachstania barnettii]CAB4253822.1 similar to Saccharomyces cerevisiae YNL258C DSL1 Peripheral membrane protein needed for Golgi- to-ER retrograde traffic [Kazachstania barnettii]CAD1781571.1 similar to Saccharomyces cerevisiae YNL258C DSL1 Peripheral membrane protein needed for Golgi- to-ER retrograde traffic [Kazachstania barnettii]